MWLRSGVAVAVAKAGGYSSDSTPSLVTSICCGRGPKKTTKKKKKKKKKEVKVQLFCYKNMSYSRVGSFLEGKKMCFLKKMTHLSQNLKEVQSIMTHWQFFS